MLNRWWVYQQERFPVFKNGLLIAVFSFSAVSHSVLLRLAVLRSPSGEAISLRQMEGFSLLQTGGASLMALIVLFLFFLQLRIADEFKDYADDLRFRPYHPVPRGLVSLKELGIVAIATACIQLGLTLALSLPLVLLLMAVWGYLGLISKGFFVPIWLKAHPLVYLLSHRMIMPLMALYATGCDWVRLGTPPRGLIWFLLVSFWAGLAIEIGRKIRASRDEEKGVETYTALWGRQKAVMAWLGALWLTTLTTLLAALYINFVVLVAFLLLLLLTIAVLVAWRFSVRPVTAWAKRFERVSDLWTLGVYSSLGIVPLLLRSLG